MSLMSLIDVPLRRRFGTIPAAKNQVVETGERYEILNLG
jgi:hypothetical protein